jgi:hypothetical protein
MASIELGKDPHVRGHVSQFWRNVGLAGIASITAGAVGQAGINAVNHSPIGAGMDKIPFAHMLPHNLFELGEDVGAVLLAAFIIRHVATKIPFKVHEPHIVSTKPVTRDAPVKEKI